MRYTALVALLGATLLAAGCGQEVPQAATTPRKAAPAKPAPVTPPTPPPPSNQVIAKGLADKATEAFANVGTFKAEAQTIDVDPIDGDVYKAKVSVYYKAPAKFRLTVLPGSHSNEGLKMVFDDGGDHVIIRPGGFLGVARIKLGADDSRVRTSRGFPLMQITEMGILNRMSSPKSTLGYLGESAIDGTKAQVVAITGPALLQGVSEERVFLDNTTRLPIRSEMRVGKAIVFAMTIKNLIPNTDIPTDAFDI